MRRILAMRLRDRALRRTIKTSQRFYVINNTTTMKIEGKTFIVTGGASGMSFILKAPHYGSPYFAMQVWENKQFAGWSRKRPTLPLLM